MIISFSSFLPRYADEMRERLDAIMNKIRIIRKLADTILEIASSSMQDILPAKQRKHIGLAMVSVITLVPMIIQKLAGLMVEIASS